MLVAGLPNLPVVGIIAGIVILLGAIVQIVLMIFRAAAVTIMAGIAPDERIELS